MRKPIIAGNWKMHKTVSEGVSFIEELKGKVAQSDVESVICAPFTMLKSLVEVAKGTPIKIGAQNMHFEEKGAFTGEVSGEMLVNLGVTHVIIGHSERREYFAETDETVNKKTKKAISLGLTPLVCCGETLEEREGGKTLDKVKGQIEKAFEGISATDAPKVVVAYEPIWAIGTGKTASSADANETIASIRKVLENIYGSEVSEEIRIQYGGSVKPDNVTELMNQTDIDGALVGGASLKSSDYLALLNF